MWTTKRSLQIENDMLRAELKSVKDMLAANAEASRFELNNLPELISHISALEQVTAYQKRKMAAYKEGIRAVLTALEAAGFIYIDTDGTITLDED